MTIKIDHLQKVDTINQFIKDNPFASRKTVMAECSVSYHTCQKLEGLKLIKMPAPMNASIAATMNRAKRKDNGTAFRLTCTPRTNKKRPPTFLAGVDYR